MHAEVPLHLERNKVETPLKAYAPIGDTSLVLLQLQSQMKPFSQV